MSYHVQVVVRGVRSANEDYLERLMERLGGLEAVDPAVVFYPEDEEIGMCFEIEEGSLGGSLLESNADRVAA